MWIDLKKYFQGGREGLPVENALNCQLDLTGLELDGVKPFCAPIEVSAQLKSFAGSVLLEVQLAMQVTMPCDRCGEEVTRQWDKHFSHVLVRRLSNEQDDDAFVVVPEERLDLDELLREDILLDMPSKFLCSPDCKGLCPKCGKNLNEGECDCDRREIDPRLAALQELLNS